MLSRDQEQLLKLSADGLARVNDLAGYYVCDGGCDRTTISQRFADQLASEGTAVQLYSTPRVATLANGSRVPSITGYVIADLELETQAGTVFLPRTHVDVLAGPEENNVLFLGKQEETRLGLRTFAEQLVDVARSSKQPNKAEAPNDGPLSRNDQVDIRGEAATKKQKGEKVKFKAGRRVKTKRRLSSFSRNLGRKFLADGVAFVGNENWRDLSESQYLLDPWAAEGYVTTAALAGYKELEDAPGAVTVAINDLSRDVLAWLRVDEAGYTQTVEVDVRVLPDENRDTVRRLVLLPSQELRVLKSRVSAVVLGRRQIKQLEDRGREALGQFGSDTRDEEAIHRRLEEQLDEARLNGMSKRGLSRARSLLFGKAYDVWRINLGANDFADVPPLRLELATSDFRLPKPYMRRYTDPELKWWKKEMAEMVQSGIFRRTSACYLSPSNLVKKSDDGVVKEGEFRMIVDLRNLNSVLKDLDHPLPKLDEVVHAVRGAKCFAKGDGTKGYRQFLLAPESQRYTGFTCPIGTFEHLRVPMGLKTAAAYYQRCMQVVLEPQLLASVLQYLDDTLVFARSEAELIDELERMFSRMLMFNVKMHPGKFTLYAKQLTWGGREVTSEGTRPSSKRVEAILGMPDPIHHARRDDEIRLRFGMVQVELAAVR